MSVERVVVGSRRTPLALAQTELVARELARAGLDVQVRAMATEGDRSLGGSLATAKGLFTAELDRALVEGDVDLVVHSLKDLPLDHDDRVELLAVPARERENDVLVTRSEGRSPEGARPLDELAGAAAEAIAAPTAFAALPRGAVVGTSSPRRQAGTLSLRPDLVCVAVRGSVERRLERLRSGAVDALLLAEAGLVRLLRAHAATQRSDAADPWLPAAGLEAVRLELASWPSAPGQGALAVQVRAAGAKRGQDGREPAAERSGPPHRDAAALRAVATTALDHPASRRAATLERELLAALGGGCALPLGATVDGNAVHAALAAGNWRAFAGAGAAPPLARGSFPLGGFDPHRAARELLDAVAAAGPPEPPVARSLRLDGSVPPPRLVVTSTPAAAARIVAFLERRGRVPPVDDARSGAVAALEVTRRRALPGSWPVERVAIGEDRRRWPWVLVSSPGAASILVERAATETVWQLLGWCALGEGTARALLELGIPAGLCAGGRSAAELAAFALRHLDPEATIFLPQSALAAGDLADRLRERGREVVDWPAYTVEPVPDLRWPTNWDPPANVLFTAPSSAASWSANGLPWPRESWAMGAATQRELERLGATGVRLVDAAAEAAPPSGSAAAAPLRGSAGCAP
jgi:hydroxymethylbilane synthase